MVSTIAVHESAPARSVSGASFAVKTPMNAEMEHRKKAHAAEVTRDAMSAAVMRVDGANGRTVKAPGFVLTLKTRNAGLPVERAVTGLMMTRTVRLMKA